MSALDTAEYYIHNYHVQFALYSKFHKSWSSLQFWDQICPCFLISGQDPQFSNIIFKINELDLRWVPDFIALGIYFNFATKVSWNEGVNNYFNVECVLLGCNFGFFRWLRNGYCLLPSGYWWLLLVPTFCMNPF